LYNKTSKTKLKQVSSNEDYVESDRDYIGINDLNIYDIFSN
jgi:hypothetical protein